MTTDVLEKPRPDLPVRYDEDALTPETLAALFHRHGLRPCRGVALLREEGEGRLAGCAIGALYLAEGLPFTPDDAFYARPAMTSGLMRRVLGAGGRFSLPFLEALMLGFDGIDTKHVVAYLATAAMDDDDIERYWRGFRLGQRTAALLGVAS
jgi:hypothetical protein